MNTAYSNDECDPPFNKLLDQRETAEFRGDDMSTDSLYWLDAAQYKIEMIQRKFIFMTAANCDGVNTLGAWPIIEQVQQSEMFYSK